MHPVIGDYTQRVIANHRMHMAVNQPRRKRHTMRIDNACRLIQATSIVDAHGVTLAPGLIDSHVHPVIGDYTPRQQQINWIDSCLHGGVTTMISAGEVHAPGRPKDIVGLKAMAIASQRWYENFRPSGVKMLAGAPVIEEGMVESDFKELADAGVTLLGEVGLGSVKAGETAAQMVKWARKYGIQSTICLLYTSPSPRDRTRSRMPSSA